MGWGGFIQLYLLAAVIQPHVGSRAINGSCLPPGTVLLQEFTFSARRDPHLAPLQKSKRNAEEILNDVLTVLSKPHKMSTTFQYGTPILHKNYISPTLCKAGVSVTLVVIGRQRLPKTVASLCLPIAAVVGPTKMNPIPVKRTYTHFVRKVLLLLGRIRQAARVSRDS